MTPGPDPVIAESIRAQLGHGVDAAPAIRHRRHVGDGVRWMVESPIGRLAVDTDGDTVVGVRFAAPPGGSPATGPVADEFARYFAGASTSFALPVRVPDGSDFERAVWDALTRIPYGQMRTYGQIAAALGDAGAARAVGTACNRNPVPVIVPCHRVVGAGGKLVGFGGGLDRKRRLLELEARVTFERAWTAQV